MLVGKQYRVPVQMSHDVTYQDMVEVFARYACGGNWSVVSPKVFGPLFEDCD